MTVNDMVIDDPEMSDWHEVLIAHFFFVTPGLEPWSKVGKVRSATPLLKP